MQTTHSLVLISHNSLGEPNDSIPSFTVDITVPQFTINKLKLTFTNFLTEESTEILVNADKYSDERLREMYKNFVSSHLKYKESFNKRIQQFEQNH